MKKKHLLTDKTFFSSIYVCLMVFNAAVNNISVILWRFVLLLEETGGSGENHRPVTFINDSATIEIYNHNKNCCVLYNL